MDEMTKGKPGRPAGSVYDQPRSIRFSGIDLERLHRLAQKWEIADAGAIRRAIREAAEREGLE